MMMPPCLRMLLILLSAMAGLSSFALKGWALSTFDPPKTFTATKSCDAVSSIRSGKGAMTVNKGQSFKALGTNKKKPDATHVQIDVKGKRKWIAMTCGTLGVKTAGRSARSDRKASQAKAPVRAAPRQRASKARQSRFRPFFDNQRNPEKVRFGGPADMTPPAPRLEPFDRAVNRLCGPMGANVSANGFKKMMRAHPNVLKAIQTFTGGKVFGQERAMSSPDAYLDKLADAWFNHRGFKHIYCGEPHRGKVGGLHFWGRYLDLQEKQMGGRLPNNASREEVQPGAIYSVGVEMQVDGQTVRSTIKGYGLTLSAADLLKAGTQALADNPTRSNRNEACVLRVQDDGKTFSMVFVRQAKGIRTFFPDATPSTSDPVCRRPVAIR